MPNKNTFPCRLAFGTIAGGAGARLTGGNFWQGAATGLAVSWFNHHLHNKPNRVLIRRLNNEIDDEFGNKGSGKAEASQRTLDRISKLPTCQKLIKSEIGKIKINYINKSTSENGAAAEFYTDRNKSGEEYTGSDGMNIDM